MVTLLGPGGVGKTRLAAEVALRRNAATGVESCFVDLTKVSDAALVAGLVARELGIRVEAGSDAERVLEEALRRRPVLLVLDNFEHVLDAAGIARRLVQWSPDVRVLTTSRARLRVAGEQVFDVVPLSLEPTAEGAVTADAVTLFEQVATAVDPQFQLAPHHDDVVRICRAVDGLPLAIELAAGHVRTLPPSLLLARLGARLGSASGATRDAPARQQTVAATIEWSLQLVADDERDLFRSLGIFAGPVPLEVVERVCESPGHDVVESLSKLVDHSLVRRVSDARGEPRFVLLELLRARAREMLAADVGVQEVLARRHASYVADFLDALDESRWTDDSDRWIELITGLLAEIRLAHARAVELGEHLVAVRMTAGMGTYWHREGHHAEGKVWVVQALAHPDGVDDFLAARLQLCAGFVEWTHDEALAHHHWDEAVSRFRALGHDRYLSYALALVAVTYVGDADNHDRAIRLCEESIALARTVDERPLLAQALNVMGELTRVIGDDAMAEAAYREGLELAIAADDDAHASMLLGNLSFLADHRGDYEAGRTLGLDAVRLAWSAGRRLIAAMNVMQLVGPETGLGRPERAAVLLGASDESMRRLGVGLHLGDVPEHERVEDGLRDVLGEEDLQRLLAEGAALSLEDTIAFALSDDERLGAAFS